MLLSFSLGNWMYFRDEVQLSMLTTRERRHLERLPGLEQFGKRVLPIAVILGANGSGKTGIARALSFAKGLITRLPRIGERIEVRPFAFDSNAGAPCRFEFVLLCGGSVYDYAFEVGPNAVFHEKLSRLEKSGERVLFERKDNDFEFDDALPEREVLPYAARGTRANQLFVTVGVNLGLDWCRPVYDWFDQTLSVHTNGGPCDAYVLPSGCPRTLPDGMDDLLVKLDTGIVSLKLQAVSFGSLLIDDVTRNRLLDTLRVGGKSILLVDLVRNHYLLGINRDGDVEVGKIVSYHRSTDEEVGSDPVPFNEESEGVQRIVALCLAFSSLLASGSDKVLFIDDYDRNLHPLVSRALIEDYLDGCAKDARSQLFLVAHDSSLIDEKLFRHDEFWVCNRDPNDVSTFYSFGDFERGSSPGSIRRAYLKGLYGGVPQVF